MPSPTAPAAASGLPAIDFAASIFPRAKLDTMGMRDLFNLFQLISSLQGAVTQSLFISGHGRQTAAGEMLEELSGVLVCAMSDVSQTAQNRQPIDAEEANWRGWSIGRTPSPAPDGNSEPSWKPLSAWQTRSTAIARTKALNARMRALNATTRGRLTTTGWATATARPSSGATSIAEADGLSRVQGHSCRH